MTVSVNFDKITGRIKPLHGIGNAPLLGTNPKLFPYLKEAGIPYSRLHDTGGRYGGGCFVDINNVFRDFDRDPKDPDSYDFAFTDWLITELVQQGVKPFYRLGTTIENSHRIKAYYIYPPKDKLKWAQICEGIIRHYNEGWASGFYYDIEYWEIWNEPDNEPNIEDNPMWKGTMEEYFELYKVASNYLKDKFPHLKVGGYASCGFYYLSEAVVESANSSTRTGYFIHFFNEFLKFITSEENKSPLDFFSWHSYANPQENIKYAKYARKMLDEYGLYDTETILNEWNPGIQYRSTSKDCANIAAMFCALQKAPVDKAMYYDGQVHTSYGGMFDPVKQDIFKAYYAFYAFNKLYELSNEIECSSSKEGIYTIAAKDTNTARILISNPTEKEYNLAIQTYTRKKITSVRKHIVDRDKNFEETDENRLTPESIILIEYEFERNEKND
jgi:xylan 1,4-beta-xylosidase